MRRVLGVIVVLSLPSAIALGCGEDTPQGRDLASPAERQAVPAPGAGTPPPEIDEDPVPAPRAGAPAAIGDAPERPSDPGASGEEPEPTP